MVLHILSALALLPCLGAGLQSAHQSPVSGIDVKVNWAKYLRKSETSATLQAVMQPPMARTSPTHDAIWSSLRASSSDFVRLQGWYPYPHYIVAELEPPVTKGKKCSTSWNFTLMDQLMDDYFTNTPNASHSIALTTTPAWMWTNSTNSYPKDINTADFAYNQGTLLRDSTFKEVADYYARVVSWYTKGGFTDECGVYHKSGHRYKFDIWEVLNEIDFEHELTPEYYTKLYDAVVTTVKHISPKTEFLGVNLVGPELEYFDYFLNHNNHAPGIPLDHIAFHFYAYPRGDDDLAAKAYGLAANWTTRVLEKIESVRDELSPNTKIYLNEVGSVLPAFNQQPNPVGTIPDDYWVWSGGVYAYIWSHALLSGVEAVGASQLSGIIGNYPEVSLVNQTTGGPNARMRILNLIQGNFGPGDHVHKTSSSNSTLVHAQAFVTKSGQRKMLVINKSTKPTVIKVAGFDGGRAQVVDLTTRDCIWRTETILGNQWKIPALGTAVLTAKCARGRRGC